MNAEAFAADQTGKREWRARNMLPPGSKFCLCRGCGEYFTGPSAFDAHRVGKYEITAGPDRRRCLSVAEMRLAAWRKTPTGYWTNRPEFDRASSAYVAGIVLPARVGDAISPKTLCGRGSG